MMMLSGVNGNQLHIHTSLSLESKHWLSEYLSDHCETAKCLSFWLWPFYRVSLHMKSHSQGSGIKIQGGPGWCTDSLLFHSKKLLVLSLNGLFALFKQFSTTPINMHVGHQEYSGDPSIAAYAAGSWGQQSKQKTPDPPQPAKVDGWRSQQIQGNTKTFQVRQQM